MPGALENKGHGPNETDEKEYILFVINNKDIKISNCYRTLTKKENRTNV